MQSTHRYIVRLFRLVALSLVFPGTLGAVSRDTVPGNEAVAPIGVQAAEAQARETRNSDGPFRRLVNSSPTSRNEEQKHFRDPKTGLVYAASYQQMPNYYVSSWAERSKPASVSAHGRSLGSQNTPESAPANQAKPAGNPWERYEAAKRQTVVHAASEPVVITNVVREHPTSSFAVNEGPKASSHAVQRSSQRTGFFSRLLPSRWAPQAAPEPQIVSTGYHQAGVASWYGPDFHGGPTASGEMYDMESMTAAHRSLPFGTLLRVTNLKTGKDCIVRVNNRGPFYGGRILDLSKAAARQIGMLGSGIAKVQVEVLSLVEPLTSWGQQAVAAN